VDGTYTDIFSVSFSVGSKDVGPSDLIINNTPQFVLNEVECLEDIGAAIIEEMFSKRPQPGNIPAYTPSTVYVTTGDKGVIVSLAKYGL
jgi:hypothetical protein